MPGSVEARILATDFLAIPRDMRKNLRPKVQRAARPVLRQARSNASWSTRIPGSTRVSVKFAGRSGVSIVVSSKRSPHARPYENRGRQGNFRHPVFASQDETRSEWTWVSQRARPFLFRAVVQKADEAAEIIGDLVPEVARRHGWH